MIDHFLTENAAVKVSMATLEKGKQYRLLHFFQSLISETG